MIASERLSTQHKKMQFYCGGKQIVAPFIHQLTKALEDNMEERNDGSVHEAVQLVDKCLFDHLVS